MEEKTGPEPQNLLPRDALGERQARSDSESLASTPVRTGWGGRSPGLGVAEQVYQEEVEAEFGAGGEAKGRPPSPPGGSRAKSPWATPANGSLPPGALST